MRFADKAEAKLNKKLRAAGTDKALTSRQHVTVASTTAGAAHVSAEVDVMHTRARSYKKAPKPTAVPVTAVDRQVTMVTRARARATCPSQNRQHLRATK